MAARTRFLDRHVVGARVTLAIGLYVAVLSVGLALDHPILVGCLGLAAAGAAAGFYVMSRRGRVGTTRPAFTIDLHRRGRRRFVVADPPIVDLDSLIAGRRQHVFERYMRQP